MLGSLRVVEVFQRLISTNQVGVLTENSRVGGSISPLATSPLSSALCSESGARQSDSRVSAPEMGEADSLASQRHAQLSLPVLCLCRYA